MVTTGGKKSIVSPPMIALCLSSPVIKVRALMHDISDTVKV